MLETGGYLVDSTIKIIGKETMEGRETYSTIVEGEGG
jgi:hypothetical protein